MGRAKLKLAETKGKKKATFLSRSNFGVFFLVYHVPNRPPLPSHTPKEREKEKTKSVR